MCGTAKVDKPTRNVQPTQTTQPAQSAQPTQPTQPAQSTYTTPPENKDEKKRNVPIKVRRLTSGTQLHHTPRDNSHWKKPFSGTLLEWITLNNNLSRSANYCNSGDSSGDCGSSGDGGGSSSD